MIAAAFWSLINHAEKTGLIENGDRDYFVNLLLSRLKLSEPPEQTCDTLSLCDSLKELSAFAANKGIIEDTFGERDIFETNLMGLLTPRPSEITARFVSLYKENKESATNWFYKLCCDNNYVRCEDIAKNIEFETPTSFGNLEITINLSKPEKDPKDIARAAQMPSSHYPKCALCRENEGYEGHINHPPRANLRLIPIELQGEKWGFQYSPYAYFSEHSIALSQVHRPMAIHKKAFECLLDFIDVFPHYFIGSNADLPIVGGSILSHEHYQCGRHTFPMMKAPDECKLSFRGFESLECSKVHWPMSCIRIKGEDRHEITALADKILRLWRGYTDEEAFVFAETNGEKHNTITPIAYKEGDSYVFDLVLRNNITTDTYPLGVYHPHPDKHNVKKENIGLIEVMGMAILPARLKAEIELMKKAIETNNFDLPEISHHKAWLEAHSFKNIPSLHNDILQAIGETFLGVLSDAGVYKDNNAFMKFIEYINKMD